MPLLYQGLLYTRTDFVPKEIAKTWPKSHFNANKSEVAQIPCDILEILNLIITIENSEII